MKTLAGKVWGCAEAVAIVRIGELAVTPIPLAMLG